MIQSTHQDNDHALPPSFQRFRARLGCANASVSLDARASGGARVGDRRGGGLHVYGAQLAGYGVAVLLVFRVIWGFAGSRHSRFSDFARPWREVFAHVKGMLSLRPARTLGHIPLGGWMALLLLLVLAAQVTTGLFASDDGLGGPLAGTVASGTAHALAELHEGLSGALLGLIGLHIVGVLVESLLTRDNLVRAMITGRKAVMPGEAEAGQSPAVAPGWLAALALATASGLVV